MVLFRPGPPLRHRASNEAEGRRSRRARPKPSPRLRVVEAFASDGFVQEADRLDVAKVRTAVRAWRERSRGVDVWEPIHAALHGVLDDLPPAKSMKSMWSKKTKGTHLARRKKTSRT